MPTEPIDELRGMLDRYRHPNKYKMITRKMYIEVSVPPGEYYLGDPCYVIDKGWHELLESIEGPLEVNDGVGTLGDHQILMFGTAHGDGAYPDNKGRTYPVDAGVIGLVPAALAGDFESTLGHRVTFDEPTLCRSEPDGRLVFGDITIYTDEVPGEEEDAAE